MPSSSRLGLRWGVLDAVPSEGSVMPSPSRLTCVPDRGVTRHA